MHRRLVPLALALLLLIPLADARSDQRSFSAPIGTVSMPRATSVASDGSANVSANVTLNADLARNSGARYILVSVGSDANTALAVRDASLTATRENMDGDGTNRVSFWLDARALSGEHRWTLTARVFPGPSATDVEVVLMAFTETYVAVNDPNGQGLFVQSFTNVPAATSASPPPPTGDGGFTPLPGENETGPNESVRETTPPASRTPGFSLALVLAAAVAGLVFSRRK